MKTDKSGTNSEEMRGRKFRYIGIPSRGVFCCFDCPEPLPEEGAAEGFRSIYDALNSGYTPCLVCQPDMKTDRIVLGTDVSPMVNRAVELIGEGFLNNHTTEELSEKLRVSERHLRRAFKDELGFSPSRLAAWHRAVFAKHLIRETNAPFTEIAYTSGFGSVRQFNQVIEDVFNSCPTEIRRECRITNTDESVFISYEDSFNFAGCLTELGKKMIPGAGKVTDSSYIHAFRINGSAGYVEVKDDPDRSRLILSINAENRNCYLAVYHKIRRMFDIGRDEQDIRTTLGKDNFNGYLSHNSVPRLLLWFDPVASVHYSVISQESGHEETIEILGKYARLCGDRLMQAPEGISVIYPEQIGIRRDVCRALGISERAFDVLRQIETAIDSNHIALAYNQSYRQFRRSMMKYTEAAENAVNYIAMFGMGMKNAYTYEDDWLISLNLERWENYRSYASLIYNLLN